MQNNTFSTLFVGQNLIKLSAVDSTNNYLKNLASNSEPLPEGTVIMADHQYAGRGMQGSIWSAQAGKNLTFSLLLRPNFIKADRQFELNMLVSVAINNVLSKYLKNHLSIKWPNDIYVGDQKIGGVLIENVIAGSQLKQSIIGIGLNVNQVQFDKELAGRPVSLSQILHQNVNLMVLLNEICVQVEQLYLKLKLGKSINVRELYVNNLYRLHKIATYDQNGREFEGVIEGISETGLLRIRSLSGETLEFGFKEVAFI